MNFIIIEVFHYLHPQPCPVVHLQQSVAASHSALFFDEHPHAEVVGQGELELEELDSFLQATITIPSESAIQQIPKVICNFSFMYVFVSFLEQ